MNGKFIVIEYDILDNDKLSNTEKIVYAYIVALSHDRGYCYSNNEYLCKLTKLKKRQLQYCLANLKNFNYISTTVIKNKRIITPTINNFINNRDEENENKSKLNLIDYNWLEDSEENENE